jgi:hypothetical protein
MALAARASLKAWTKAVSLASEKSEGIKMVLIVRSEWSRVSLIV